MHRNDDPERSSRVEREFTAMVDRLRRGDPRFARRLAVPPFSAHVSAGGVRALVGVLATLLLGVLPLGAGLSTNVVALLAMGAICCAALPVAAPVAAGYVLGRVRPLWL